MEGVVVIRGRHAVTTVISTEVHTSMHNKEDHMGSVSITILTHGRGLRKRAVTNVLPES